MQSPLLSQGVRQSFPGLDILYLGRSSGEMSVNCDVNVASIANPYLSNIGTKWLICNLMYVIYTEEFWFVIYMYQVKTFQRAFELPICFPVSGLLFIFVLFFKDIYQIHFWLCLMLNKWLIKKFSYRCIQYVYIFLWNKYE